MVPCFRDCASHTKASREGIQKALLGLEDRRHHSSFLSLRLGERAKKFEYPERFGQEALGHNSKAIHRSYAKRAEVRLPSEKVRTEANLNRTLFQ
jgi:hypothetical protein